jgi:hypothetical protein
VAQNHAWVVEEEAEAMVLEGDGGIMGYHTIALVASISQHDLDAMDFDTMRMGPSVATTREGFRVNYKQQVIPPMQRKSGGNVPNNAWQGSTPQTPQCISSARVTNETLQHDSSCNDDLEITSKSDSSGGGERGGRGV